MVNARDSHGNAYCVFISLEGWWTLAGGNTPVNRSATLSPGRALESILSCPIRPIGSIRLILFHYPPTHFHPKSTLANPKSTVDLGCEPLIRGENDLRPPLSPTRYQLIIRPENKGIKPKSNRHRPKNFKISGVSWLVSMMATTQQGRVCRSRSVTGYSEKKIVYFFGGSLKNQRSGFWQKAAFSLHPYFGAKTHLNFRHPILTYSNHCQPIPTNLTPPFFREGQNPNQSTHLEASGLSFPS